MAGVDSTGKAGASGEFHKQVTNWMTPTTMAAEGVDYQRQTNGSNTPILSGQAKQWMTPVVPNGGRTQSVEVVAAKGSMARGKVTVMLESQARYWPTPTAQSDQGPDSSARDGGPTLVSATTMWPTPTAALMNDGEDPAQWQARADRLKAKHTNGNGAGTPLTIMAAAWPTPASRDYRTPNLQSYEERGGEGKGEQLANFVAHRFSPQGPTTPDGPTSSPPLHGSPPPSTMRLNPYFVEWLMGWPMGWTLPTVRGASSAQETESWRSALQWRLSALLGEPGSSPEGTQ